MPLQHFTVIMALYTLNLLCTANKEMEAYRSLIDLWVKCWQRLQNLERNWQEHLPQVQSAHITAYHKSIAYIPYRIVFKEVLDAAVDSVSPVTRHIPKSPAVFAVQALSSWSDL